MKKSIKILLVAVLLAMQVNTISADTERYSDFTVTPVFTENQIGTDLEYRGYFDVMLAPEGHDILNLEVKNTGSSPMTVHVDKTNAVTRANGEADYTQNEMPSAYIPTTMASMLTIQNNDIVVNPNESAIISVDLQMPKEAFEGVILGGLAITATHESNKTKEQNSVGVNSSVKYLVAVQARNSMNDVMPKLRNGEAGAKVHQMMPAYFVTIENSVGLNMSNVSISGDIKQKSDGKVVAKVDEKNRSILPYSSFEVMFSPNDENQKIVSQLYSYDLTIKSGEESWNFKDDFQVGTEMTKDINATVKPNNNALLIYGGLAVLVIINVGLVYIVMKQRNAKKNK
ncbi:WxL protein peptidoglycan domain-containing protein [Erysipelothrix anatis]|uniref:WxL protein peptidoglycan domain-containing protein n=1 Tax=Erysipelothrix anatis TaxID=2683713 RepID=UPI00135C8460|nr:DUF916 domain-containing protein [Erysipelothrix anatis]